jgi:hypothetical protein
MLARTHARVLYTFLSALIILSGTLIAIRYAQGDRISKKGVQGTGLLVANSFPTGAEVSVNGKLVSATDDTIYLEPGEYQVVIQKDGYSAWQKNLKIERELVTQTNAQLYRRVPSLSPVTFTGVKNISPSPDGQKILFYTASASAQAKNGLYLAELNGGSSFLSSTREPRQVAEEAAGFDLSTATFTWSPDSAEVLVSTPNHEVVLDLSKKNILTALPDVSFRKKQILSQWEEQIYLRERQYLDKFPDQVIQVATQSAVNVYFSPDKKRLLYTATVAATLNPGLVKSLPASNTQTETRTIKPGYTYVYDREEDKNFLVKATAAAELKTNKYILASDLWNPTPARFETSPSAFQRLQASTSTQTASRFRSSYSSLYTTGLQWMPDSKHLLFTAGDQGGIMEYDATNPTIVYTGPFTQNFVYPWPDGSKLVILASFSANYPENLYTIELK